MVAIKAADVERFLARPDPARPIILVYGPDAGLVRERAQALIRAWVDDPQDPFQLARLEGNDLTGEPTPRSDISPAVEALVASSSSDCRVVIEAGELRRNSPLRVICERAKNAVALPCFADSADALLRLIEEEMRANGLVIAPDARAALIPLLGGDRLASRHELRKLAAFANGKQSVDLADVTAVVSDASSLELDALIDAAFVGRTKELDFQFGKARTAAMAPDTILVAALRHAGQLHKARLAIDNGTPADAAARTIAPFLPFPRKSTVQALTIWSSPRLGRAMTQLADAVLDARRQSGLGAVIAHRALLAIVANAVRNQDVSAE
ncbi:MAG: DNA polymerase III subunit delta [Alphaproteobacteria bacterium]|nr:MAG: DNA polymerase III subunit delta [Alphaproteobacteria bacterium]